MKSGTTAKPVIPGQVLSKKFMERFGLTQEGLAKSIRVARRRINEIINGKRAITTDTAMRLAQLLNTTPEYWLNLQVKYDLWKSMNDKKMVAELKKIRAVDKAR
jgi:addiction module HigA family antidote